MDLSTGIMEMSANNNLENMSYVWIVPGVSDYSHTLTMRISCDIM